MNEWKWSKGEVYYKSGRIKRDTNTNINNDNDNDNDNEINDIEINENAINDNAIKQSLDGFNDGFSTFSRNNTPSGNRREDLDYKISERELLFQRGTNPFLSNTNTDYVNDIETRDNFLKPKNTTSDKINNNNEK